MKLKNMFFITKNYITEIFKWFFLALLTGTLSGIIGSLFDLAVEYVTTIRAEHSFIIYLLPLGGIIITIIYRLLKVKNIGTDHIIKSVREKEVVPFALLPAIFSGTVITHFLGGSAGREGAALQLGGSIGSKIGSLFKLNENEMHIIIMCGMSGVFSAIFGTPVTAAIFVIEVASVGLFHHNALLPNLTASLSALYIAKLFNIHPVRFTLSASPDLNAVNMLKLTALSIAVAVVSMIFCFVMHKTHKVSAKYIKNDYLRAFSGGLIIVILTLLVGNNDYNGAGMNIIEKAISGETVPYAFLLKIIFTAVTIGFGFKGGEIIPTMFIGATFGCFAGPLFGLPADFSAAIGLIALFCAVINCPIASIILSIELFGTDNIVFFAVACAVSYVFSGYFSLYGTQKILYSKVKEEFLDRGTC